MLNDYKSDFSLFLNNYVKDCKEPAQFLSCFMALDKFYNKGKDIKIPILFDASCSGMQHLSALTTDIDLAKLTNIIGLDTDKPADFYEYCINLIINFVENMPDSWFKKKLLLLNMDRK